MHNSFTDICSLLSAGLFRYTFKNKTFSNSKSLNAIFKNCFPDDSVLTEELLKENTHPEDKQFIEELFSMPKAQKKKISGKFRLTQKTKDYKEVKAFLVNGVYSYSEENEPVLTCSVRESQN